MSLRVIGYLRRSTEKQELSLDAQRDALERWCSRSDAELLEVHHDDASGRVRQWKSELVDGELLTTRLSLAERPGLLAAIESVRRTGAAALLVVRRDRLFRDVEGMRVLARILAPAQIRATDLELPTGWAGNHIATQLDVIAETEAQLTTERTIAALATRTRSGKAAGGGIPLGLRLVDGRLEVEPDEARIVDLIVQLHHEEHLGVADIIRELGRRSIAPPRGRRLRGGTYAPAKRWHRTQIERVLERHASAREQQQ